MVVRGSGGYTPLLSNWINPEFSCDGKTPNEQLKPTPYELSVTRKHSSRALFARHWSVHLIVTLAAGQETFQVMWFKQAARPSSMTHHCASKKASIMFRTAINTLRYCRKIRSMRPVLPVSLFEFYQQALTSEARSMQVARIVRGSAAQNSHQNSRYLALFPV